MTVKELKSLLNQFDENLIIKVKDDCGEYDLAEDIYEDEEEYLDEYDIGEWPAIHTKSTWKTRKVVKIF